MNTIIINTPGPQGPPGVNGTLTDTGSLATTGSNTFNGNQTVNGSITATSFTGSLEGTSSWANNAKNAQTASYVTFIQGPGIIINGLEITASVQTVNGVYPVDGNITTTLSATITGTSASLVQSSSGAVTGSIQNGLVWIISNDPDPTKNGDTYIFNSGPVGQWYPISSLDTAAADARYLKLDGDNSPMTGDVDMGGNNLIDVGDILPAGPYTNNISAYNLGSPTAVWKDIYVSSGSINIISGSTTFKISANSSGITADGLLNKAAMLAPGYILYTDVNGSAVGDPSLFFNDQYLSFEQGASVTASNFHAHAEGQLTKATGAGSHAEGFNTQASSQYSHAEGIDTQANGPGAHAEGYATYAHGITSHAEGYGAQSYGNHSHAEGYGAQTSGQYSHAEGRDTLTSGLASHAEGWLTIASGDYSHAAGYFTVASGAYQSVIGQYNISSSEAGAFIIGNGNFSNRSNLIYAAGTSVQITGSLNISGSVTINGSSGLGTAGYIQYPLSNYAGADFGAKLQNAINSVPTGSVIDCYMESGSQTISSTITINKPVTILLGRVTIRANVGANTNVFELKSNNISIIGKGRASKSTEPGQTRILMTNSGQGYHINSTNSGSFVSASNVTRIQDLDLSGVQSSIYTTTGSGGIFMAEPDPFVPGGGNALNQIIIEGVFIEKSKAHAITLLGLILTSINNTRISQAGGHGIYIDSVSTSTLISNTYVSSANLAAYCLNGSSYSNIINCGAEGAGIGYWIRSCNNVTLIGCGAESNFTRVTSSVNNLGIQVSCSSPPGTVTLNDIGSDFKTIFKGHSYVITNGENISLISPLSALPGQTVTNVVSGSTSTRHILIKGTTSNSVIQSPRFSGDYSGSYDIGIETLGADAPRDIEIVFNPIQDGTIRLKSTTNYLAGVYITSSNTTANSTIISDQGTNTLVRAGNKIYSSYILATGSALPTYVGQEGEIKPVKIGANYFMATYIGGAWRSASLF
jgi:hypothetical protein